MQQLIECVPNISEGQNLDKINEIAHEATKVKGIKLLNIDIGKAANRTVITFVGEPKRVIDAAFLLIRKASELIDMTKHTGEHPRFGAVDVCPLVPIANITLQDVTQYAYQLGKRVGKELGLSGYYYEYAATTQQRQNLAYLRTGEYEKLKQKLDNEQWIPDFGPKHYGQQIEKSGVIAIGARNFLIAYNVNLASTSVLKANAIAYAIRESGRILKDKNTGKKVLDAWGNPIRIKGLLKSVKGIGWFIKDFGIAQVSYNLTDISVTAIHQVFEATVKAAKKRGVKVTGSELVGLVPLQCMLEAADFYAKKQNLSLTISETEKINIAINSLGLEDVKPFHPQKNIIEYAMRS